MFEDLHKLVKQFFDLCFEVCMPHISELFPWRLFPFLMEILNLQQLFSLNKNIPISWIPRVMNFCIAPTILTRWKTNKSGAVTCLYAVLSCFGLACSTEVLNFHTVTAVNGTQWQLLYDFDKLFFHKYSQNVYNPVTLSLSVFCLSGLGKELEPFCTLM
jgi:hypothetical protein